MKTLGVIFLFVLISLNTLAQLTTQEKLGYAKDAKLLIIHSDDLGVAHSVNEASEQAMEKGSVSSASIMVPCPWFSEIAAYARIHPKADFGLHLTLTSEWKYYKWSPVASKTDVPGLVNKNGFMYSSVDSVFQFASMAEIETELRAQIEKAKHFGIDFTHLDSHMAALFSDAEHLKILIKLGREYKVPVLLNKSGPRSAFNVSLENYLSNHDVQLDGVFTANPAIYKNGMDNFYTDVIKNLKPGLTELIIHAGYDDSELRAVATDHPDWGAAWRQADVNFFTSDKCKELLREQNIYLVTWREVRDKLIR
jgi:predicted glycoside hydrolase/deacetylase ChbG (UPF0249 family)